MNEVPLFTALLVSRSRPRRMLLRRGIGVAMACLLHLAGIAVLALAPLVFLEIVDPPTAVVGPIIILENPHPQMTGSGDRSSLPSVRRGERPARGTPSPDDRGPTRLKPYRRPAQTAAVPLAPPERDEASQSLLSPPEIPSEGWSEEGSYGLDGGPSGSPHGCDGCRGKGTGEDGEGGGGDGLGEIFGPGDPRVTKPVMIESTRALPKYPEVARRARVDGTVILIIVIGSDGAVGQVEVLRAPDQRFGFDLSAIEAVKRWRYRPALLSGRPVSVYAQVIVEFTLSR